MDLTLAVLESKPWLKWNAFVALLSCSALEDLHPSQHAAWRAQQYDAEVQSGGHGQYLEISAGAGLDEAVDALLLVGAPRHAELLRSAVREWRAGSLSDQQSAALDATFAELEPSLSDVLRVYLEAHQDCFVALR